MLIFNSKNLTDTQKNKLQKIVSYIVCVYAPLFLIIHLNPKAPEDQLRSISFTFHRDLLSCFVEIDPNIKYMRRKVCLEKMLL